MIPKVIHYCWFGHTPLPPLAEKCIASWRKFMPDYEIKEWNESNFDVNIIHYTAEAYTAKKYAFVSDFARFWIIYNYGGVYFDTDVEVIKPMDDILSKGPYMGFELNPNRQSYGLINPGLGFAANRHENVLKSILDFYGTIHLKIDPDLKRPKETVVHYTTCILKKYGLKKMNCVQQIAGIYIYTSDYFAPINFITKKLHITENTHTIHRYMASWTSNSMLKKKFRNYIPEWLLLLYNRIKQGINK